MPECPVCGCEDYKVLDFNPFVTLKCENNDCGHTYSPK